LHAKNKKLVSACYLRLMIRQEMAMASVSELLQVLNKNKNTKLYTLIKKTLYEPIVEKYS
jgi:hypothetical protein